MDRHANSLTALATAWLLYLPASAQAASFRCTGHLTDVEAMICSNPTLSQADEGVDYNYKMALEHYDPRAMQRDQQRFLAERNRCRDASCIEDAYHRRATQLERLRRPPVPGCTGGVSVCLNMLW